MLRGTSFRTLMTHQILIVDDDLEFNALIGDVFSQADDSVETTADAESALILLREESYDLVVTDYRMPGANGLELVEKIRSEDLELPIIMVSGFLENGVIRELIRLGIGGVFTKPLNIFSLLKKAEELIKREEVREAGLGETLSVGFGASVGYPFQAYPCRDQVTRDFARRLHDFRNFSKCLLLIAESGTDVRTICGDLISAGDRCRQVVFCPAKTLTPELTTEILSGDDAKDYDGVTFVFEQTAELSLEQQEHIASLARRKTETEGVPRRFIFILDRHLDDYYDEGVISEEFYLFLGTSELKAPKMADLQEDLPVIAEAILTREFPGKELQGAALAFLQRHQWVGGMAGFFHAIQTSALVSRENRISSELLQRANAGSLEMVSASSDNEEAGPHFSPLESHLRRRRADYLEAFEGLVENPQLSPVETTA